MKKTLMLLIAVLALTVGSFAQNGAFAPYVTAGVGVQAGGIDITAKKNPNFSFGGGIESSTKRFLLDAHTSYNTADNITITNFGEGQDALKNGGYTLQTQASAYLKLGHVLAGAGVDSQINNVRYSISEIRNAFSTQSVHPFVGVGLQTSKFRVIGNYLLPGKDAQLNERIVQLNSEVFVTKHVRVTGGTTLNSFVPTFTEGIGRQLKIGVQGGIKIVL